MQGQTPITATAPVSSASRAGSPEPGSATEPRIAVLVPCRNEERAIGRVVRDFQVALPTAAIYVYDNASTDRTSEVAREAGAIVRHEPLPGKGNVVRRMFADIEADVFVLVDGDATYHAPAAPGLIEMLRGERLDMVNAARVSNQATAYRPGRRLGNALLTGMVALLFGDRIGDLLSGYRVLSRRFVKSFPALSQGFEIETEITVHALELRMPLAEVPTPYCARPQGSTSKLRTLGDGIRILATVLRLVKEERPLAFFSVFSAFCALLSLVLIYPIFIEFLATHLVPRFPTAFLSASLMLLAFLSLAAGFILDTVTRGRLEMKRMWYLSLPPCG